MPIPGEYMTTLEGVVAITLDDKRSFLVATEDESAAVRIFNRVAKLNPGAKLPQVRSGRVSKVAAIKVAN